MSKFRRSWRSTAAGGALWLLAFVSQSVLAAPAISGASGTFDHKASVTISGSSFGTKSTAAPLVWDDASGTSFSSKWDGAWPNNNSAYNTTYRATMRGINPPHSRVGKYIAGGHGDSAGANGGYNVAFWKNVPASVSYVYASWYQRVDDAWVFGGDNNLKTFAYSNCCSPYEMPNNWYLAYGPPNPSSKTSGAGWIINDDGGSLGNPDINGHNAWWGGAVNPMAGQWSKVEVAIKVSSGSDGYVKVWENGTQEVGYAGPTDKYPGTSRTIGIGGYARIYGQPNNWRYFADAYVDTSLARVVLANKATLSTATVIENQIPTSWSAGSVTASVNLGKFTAGQTAYLIVVDPSGSASPGFAVTVGGSASQKTPKAPSAVDAE